jgi:hypothetical protein
VRDKVKTATKVVMLIREGILLWEDVIRVRKAHRKERLKREEAQGETPEEAQEEAQE